ncbi:hypothetical protein H3Z83_07605 [Tenacibaculum sp. S7007]|uniref:Uncharacterized protein n=1 Tax=Tenacibaculum pelagium TaxID=2759527 RepID=A0A839APE1_9FLAO|nr:hypothetical protein [Tenacibaculum pelagium]MBA6156377.1 hypothetical protein [Tenacibaculum pelagium]
MKKSILNLGKALNKAEQKEINGGLRPPTGPCTDSYKPCSGNHDCPRGQGRYIMSDNIPVEAVCLCLI